MPDDSSPARRREPIVPVLVVDGDEERLKMLQPIASELHCHLLQARTMQEVLEQLRTQDFAAVLLLVPAKAGDRLDWLRQIRTQTGSRTPLVLILQAEANGFPCLEAFRLGAADCLVEPLAPEALRARLGVFAERFRLIADHRQVVAQLRRANQAKDQFLAMLAHELRNPLGPVLNGLHLLRLAGSDRIVSDRAREMMERQIRHMARLVDDLLDVSRIARGKIQLHCERLDLVKLVVTATEDRRDQLLQAGLALHSQWPEIPVWVRGDSTRLAQVMYNLLDNAIKFGGRDKAITVGVSTESATREAVVFVRDEGIGIAPELLPRVFDVFAQADRSLERDRGGLGLGLALVKGLIELHGGTVTASSAGVGKGAEFTVRLPLEPEPQIVSTTPSGRRGGLVPQRVLVIEDNRDAADMLRLVLQLQGHEVRVAYTGTDGVQIARDWRPDIILCDIGLPGLDGYAVAAALRRDPTTSRSRLIAITGYGGEENRRRALQAGFDQHLIKPVSPDQLQMTLAQSKT